MNSKVNKSLNLTLRLCPQWCKESCRSGKTCKYGRWACIGVLWQNCCPHIKHEAVFNTNHALATAEDTRHCFHRVAYLTIIHMFAALKYMGRTSEGGECCRTSSDPILCVHSLPLWVMWPAQWAQEAGNIAQLTRSWRGLLGEATSSFEDYSCSLQREKRKVTVTHSTHVTCQL